MELVLSPMGAVSNVQWLPGALRPEIKRPGHEVDGLIPNVMRVFISDISIKNVSHRRVTQISSSVIIRIMK
jgi:hypothetical protein